MRKQAEMSIEVKENGEYVEHIAYPYVEYDHVTFENGMQIEKALEDDVAMPTVAHDTSSFKVGQGDSDVSDSIVDGSIASMSIKGQTYQNILPSPTLRNSMTDGNTMQKINEGYDSVEVVDGNVKSAILKGNTLVNVRKTISMIASDIPEIRLDTSLMKANTKYSVFVTGVPNDRKWAIVPYVPYTNNQNATFVTSENLETQLKFYISLGNVMTKEEIERVNITIVEGDVPLEMHFEGMQSVKMPVLTTVGKNLFDGKIEPGGINSNTGDNTSWSTSFRTDFLVVPKSENNFIFTFNYKGIKVNDGRLIIVYYDKDKNRVGYLGVDSGQSFKFNQDAYYYRITQAVDDNLNILDIDNLQLEQGTQATTYEPYKSNILSTSEDVELRGIRDVRDELNLLTGEVTERIGEIVLDGSENWTTYNYIGTQIFKTIVIGIRDDMKEIMCNRINNSNAINNDTIHFKATSNGIEIMLDDSSITTIDNFKQYISLSKENPIIIQYQLATESIKTVDLSTSGNWEKVVLDGSESWALHSSTSNLTNCLHFFLAIGNIQKNSTPFSDSFKGMEYKETASSDNERIMIGGSQHLHINILKSRLDSNDVIGFKQYLQQNPITVWYQTATHQDSTNVKEMLSFANGHIQLTSQNGSLIPSINYEVPTSNSYYLDLAKPSTQYTMKNMTGTFTLDGTQYNASANGTFTTPSTMTDKFMITSVAQSQPMLLEGDMTSEEVPYVEGIKSVFEGVDKVEIYSVGKNLFDGVFEQGYLRDATGQLVDNNQNNYEGVHSVNYIPIKENTIYSLSVILGNEYNGYNTSFYFYDENKNYLGYVPNTNKARSKENAKYMRFRIFKSGGKITKEYCNTDPNVKVQVVEDSIITTYESHKSNTTSFPITNPLRSLPNGVRDEIVLDRMNNKAKLIQRVSEDLTQLETPIVTQVDIEGFPYVYKDGHIFLNTEVAPTTEVRYSINQSQIIESQSEDIVRHSKEIDNLYNLIATYVQVNYDSTLLNLKTKGV